MFLIGRLQHSFMLSCGSTLSWKLGVLNIHMADRRRKSGFPSSAAWKSQPGNDIISTHIPWLIVSYIDTRDAGEWNLPHCQFHTLWILGGPLAMTKRLRTTHHRHLQGHRGRGLSTREGETLSQGLGISTRSLSGDSSCSVQLILRNYNPWVRRWWLQESILGRSWGSNVRREWWGCGMWWC